MQTPPVVGVVIVTYQSDPVISDCLNSLLKSDGVTLKIVVCDNASSDGTVQAVKDCARDAGTTASEVTFEQTQDLKFADLGAITLVHTGKNRGFAGGVNIGLSVLHSMPEVDLYWVVNPDVIALPSSAADFARTARANPGFGLMGGRVIYTEPLSLIQTDGGSVSRFTGVCRNINNGERPEDATRPSADKANFIAGMSMVASPAFLDQVGLMREDYFLFFEEVDWALRRGDLPLIICPDATVHHHGGTSIGSGAFNRRASGFANYFNYRNRIWLMKRFHPIWLPVAYAESTARIVKILLGGGWHEAWGAFCGLNGLRPPRDVAARVGPEAAHLAFGARSKN